MQPDSDWPGSPAFPFSILFFSSRFYPTLLKLAEHQHFLVGRVQRENGCVSTKYRTLFATYLHSRYSLVMAAASPLFSRIFVTLYTEPLANWSQLTKSMLHYHPLLFTSTVDRWVGWGRWRKR
jgi:hypothetical protein